jgi:hypothetical protein
MLSKRPRIDLPICIRDDVVIDKYAPNEILLRKGFVINSVSAQELLEHYGAESKVGVIAGRLCIMLNSNAAPGRCKTIEVICTEPDTPTVPKSVIANIALRDHTKWSSAMSWVAKCLTLCKGPTCKMIARDRFSIQCMATQVWLIELVNIKACDKVREFAIFENGGVIDFIVDIY